MWLERDAGREYKDKLVRQIDEAENNIDDFWGGTTSTGARPSTRWSLRSC